MSTFSNNKNIYQSKPKPLVNGNSASTNYPKSNTHIDIIELVSSSKIEQHSRLVQVRQPRHVFESTMLLFISVPREQFLLRSKQLHKKPPQITKITTEFKFATSCELAHLLAGISQQQNLVTVGIEHFSWQPSRIPVLDPNLGAVEQIHGGGHRELRKEEQIQNPRSRETCKEEDRARETQEVKMSSSRSKKSGGY